MKNISNRVQQLLVLVIIVSALLFAMQITSAIGGIERARNGIIGLGRAVIRSLESGGRVFMMVNQPESRIADFIAELTASEETVKNIVIYNDNGSTIIWADEKVNFPLRVGLTESLVIEHEGQIILYKPVEPLFGMRRHMMGRLMDENGHMPLPSLTIALQLDTRELNEQRLKVWLMVAGILVVQVALIMALLYVMKMVRINARQQEELRKAEKDAELGKFAGILAHEIKNPLSSMRGLISYAQKKQNDEQAADCLSRSIDEVQRLDDIVNDFLMYGRELVIETGPADIRLIIDRTVGLVRYEVKQRHVDVVIEGESFSIRADIDRMQQVMLNLLLNAVQAAPEGGTVTVELDPDKRTMTIMNMVADPEPVDGLRLFDPFYSTKEKGSGLGLAVTKKILDAHGFSITIADFNPFIVIVFFDGSDA